MTEATIGRPSADSAHPAAGEMARAYDPSAIERRIYERWLAADVFAPDGAGSRADANAEPFVIIQPPPNVTGALHLGHALTTAIEDLMVRRARMQGRPTLWLPGVDHASIAAHLVLDRIIAAEGESRRSLGRERYLERMWRFMEETRGVIAGQHHRLGASADWGRLRFTMDEGSAEAVRTSFKRIHDDGLAYRGERLVNWCPGCGTSISDLEVVARPGTGTLWSIRYHLVGDDDRPDPDATITVATTRPETILGDTAVAVHPDDLRYRDLVGRRVLIPFVERVVPIVADEMVERAFGTGAVKITPAHDQADFETAERHGLPLVDVMDDGARINERGAGYAGLSREEARARILDDLRKAGDLIREEPHEMVIGRCQRSDDIVEPRLKTQWFIRVGPMAERAMAAVREGRTRIVPARLEREFFRWMEDIRDWNVSRQLWWGHRIPAWYCPDGHVTVSDKADGPDSCSTCGRSAEQLRQDEDIFDTWYSSGLWPFSTLGWPEQAPDLARYYPGSVLETGYDILFFWVARMMMLGEWLMAREPFATVYLHGLVRDPLGAKMGKSKGNVVDPLSVIEEVGADALRFALVNGTAPGVDQRLAPSHVEGARNFANKLWNATRFVVMARPESIAADAPLELPFRHELRPADHWILSRCIDTVAAVDAAYDSFQFGEVTRLLHEAIWSEYCDWYLELAKVDLTGDDTGRRESAWRVLAWVLDRYLRLLHPVMPHITEDLWERLPHRPDEASLLIVARWPDTSAAAAVADREQAAATDAVLALITGIRNARAEARIDASATLGATVRLEDRAARAGFEALAPAVERLARVRVATVEDRAALEEGGETLSVVVPGAEARLTRGDGDLVRERERLARELEEAERLRQGTAERLADHRFIQRAPSHVVDAARGRLAELDERIARLRERLG